jgi:hypothetical protein
MCHLGHWHVLCNTLRNGDNPMLEHKNYRRHKNIFKANGFVISTWQVGLLHLWIWLCIVGFSNGTSSSFYLDSIPPCVCFFPPLLGFLFPPIWLFGAFGSSLVFSWLLFVQIQVSITCFEFLVCEFWVFPLQAFGSPSVCLWLLFVRI